MWKVNSAVLSGISGRAAEALTSTLSADGLLGVGLGGDSSPRMIAFQGRIEF